MHMLVSTELHAMRAIVDRMLGGVELREAPAEQELTEIELAIARRVLDSIVEELSRTWEELIGVTLAVDWLDVQLQNLQLAPPSEPTIALTVQIHFDELTASLSVAFRSARSRARWGGCRPAPATCPARARPTSRRPRRSPSRCRRRSSSCGSRSPRRSCRWPTCWRCSRATSSVSTRQADTGVTLFAEVVPVHRARPGRRGAKRAVEVLERLEAYP